MRSATHSIGGTPRGWAFRWDSANRLARQALLTWTRVARHSKLWDHAGAVPTYDYQCRSCGSVTEVIHSMLEDGPSVCERCGGELRRVLYPTGIIFKGSGFYRTDSRKDGYAAGF